MPSTPRDVALEFLPSFTKAGENTWKNTTWSFARYFTFTDLQPFTKYNMTVYVRNKKTSKVFPPAKFIIASTKEGIPSEPWNLTAKQINTTHVLLSWNPPQQPKGVIISYKIVLNSSDWLRTLILSGNETSYSLSSEFRHNGSYNFRVSKTIYIVFSYIYFN